MKSEKIDHRYIHIVDYLRTLPRKMLQIHGFDNATEFVLHELCSKNCFNISKAAYFVENPDFNHLKGVVGISGNELTQVSDIWKNPDFFTNCMTQSLFNQKVRSFSANSHRKQGQSEQEIAKTVAGELGMNNYTFYSWGMKHDNHGLLVCENSDTDEYFHDIMLDGLSLLSFCPIH